MAHEQRDMINRAVFENNFKYGMYLLPSEGKDFFYGFSERSIEEANAEIRSKGYVGRTIGFTHMDPKDRLEMVLTVQQLNAQRRR